MYRIPLENEQITKALTTPYAPVDFTEEEKEQFRENIGAIGGSGGGSSVVVDDEFIRKISTYNQLAKIKKLTGKSVVQNNAIVDAAIKGFGSTGKNLYGNVLKGILNADGGITADNEYEYSDYSGIYGATNVVVSYGTRPTDNYSRVCWYDGNKTFISRDLLTINNNLYATVTPPTNAVYVRVCSHISAKNIQIEVSTTPTPYEPYNPYYRNFPIVLRSVGSVADTVEDTGNGYKVTRRVGSVDLGSLTYTYSSSGQYFEGRTVGGITTKSGGYIAICGRYERYEQWPLIDKTFELANSRVSGDVGKIVIKDTAYTDATAFKSAMNANGVILNYELATPIVEYHDYNLTYPVIENGTEYFDSPVAVPCTIEYGVDIINDIIAGVVGGDTERDSGSFDLLWENASPSSIFSPQVINIDVKPYRLIYVLCFGTNVYHNQIGTMAAVSPNALIDIGRALRRNYHRVVGITSSYQIDVDKAFAVNTYGTDTEDNSMIIPYRIYGIK